VLFPEKQFWYIEVHANAQPAQGMIHHERWAEHFHAQPKLYPVRGTITEPSSSALRMENAQPLPVNPNTRS